MTDPILDRFEIVKFVITKYEITGKIERGFENIQELYNEYDSLKSQLESKLAQTDKYDNLTESIRTSSNDSLSLKEIDELVAKISQNEKDVQELSQLRPIVQALAIEFNKHKNHGEHCTCEYCYLLKDIPELKSILTTGEAKPN